MYLLIFFISANARLAVKLSVHLDQYLCDNHTMQLGVNETFKNLKVQPSGRVSTEAKMSEVLLKCQNLGSYVHRSSTAVRELKKACEIKGTPYLKIVLPNETRWNSRGRNIKSVVKLKPALLLLVREGKEFSLDWEEKVPTVAEFKLAEGAVEVLDWVVEITKVWESEKVPTMNRVIEKLYSLDSKLQDYAEDETNCM